MFLLIQKHDSTALARQGYTGIKKTQLLVQTVFLIEVSFFSEKNIEKLPWKVLFVVSYNFANGKASKNLKLFTNPLTTLRAGF